jgi:hypothetical protein
MDDQLISNPTVDKEYADTGIEAEALLYPETSPRTARKLWQDRLTQARSDIRLRMLTSVQSAQRLVKNHFSLPLKLES